MTIKIYLLLTFFILTNTVISQNKFQDKNTEISWEQMMMSSDYSFKEIQDAFYKHWKNMDYIKDDGYNLFKRWEYNMEQIVDSSGYFDKDILEKEYVRYLEKRNSNYYRQSAGNWVQKGPFGFVSEYGVGRVNVISFDPNDVDVLWLGAASGGLWNSKDGGLSWSFISTDFRMMGVSDIAIDNQNSNVIYIATGDRDAGDTYSYGVLKSINNGATWEKTNFPLTSRITKIIIDQNNGKNLYASTSNGIYKTTDGGISWLHILKNDNIKDMKTKPGDFNTIYATNTGANSGSLSFYRSTNGGVNFTSYNVNGMSNSVDRAAIGVTVSNPNVIYLSAGENKSGWDKQDFEGIYKSIDSGISFEKVSVNLAPELGSQSWYDWTFAVSPIDENKLFAGGVRFYTSDDGGKNWYVSNNWNNPSNNDHFHVDHHFAGFQPNTNYLYVGNDGGAYKSFDMGKNWMAINNDLSITQYYKLSSSATVKDLIIAGAQDNGTHLLKDNNWKRVMGGDGMDCNIDHSNADIMYASYQRGYLRKSINRGKSFKDMINPNTTDESGAWVTPFTIDPQQASTIYAGFENVWKSENKGKNWEKISNELNGSETIRGIEVSESDNNFIYINYSYKIFRSEDKGNTWSEIIRPENNYVRDVSISPLYPNKIWVTIGNNIYKSIDKGESWTKITGGLPSIPKTSIVIQNNSIESVYVGTYIGVFYIDSTLIDWVPFDEGLPPVRIGELEINNRFGKIVAGSYGRGVWESDLYDFNYDIPFCAKITYPEIGDRILENNITMKWDSAAKATGYVISIGTESGDSNIINRMDVGNKLSYVWDDIQVEGTVYVSITPYNEFGFAENCQESYFKVGCSFEDKSALINLYKTLGGENWKIKWDTLECDLRKWYGVGLNDDGRVIMIDLDGEFDGKPSVNALGNNLIGTIDSTIANIEFLKKLYLAHNSLGGDLPESFSNIIGLEELDLSYNSFSGSFPEVLSKLKYLKFLNLSSNKYSGEINTNFKWKSLEILLLRGNNFSGKIPGSLGNLKKCNSIDLSGNDFTGKIPYQIWFLKKLYLLDLSHNQISGKLSKLIINMEGLKYLLLSHNQLTDNIPSELSNNTWQYLDLSNNNFTGCFDPKLKKLCGNGSFVKSFNNPGMSNNGDFSAFCSQDKGNCNKLPGCSEALVMLTGADTLFYKDTIVWMEVDNAKGYEISLGTTSSGDDILKRFDVGSNNYFNVGELPINKNIYINIYPYNDFGSAFNCSELGFYSTDKVSSLFENDTLNIGNKLQFYPIPTHDYIFISKVTDYIFDYSIDILDMSGVSVLAKKIDKKSEKIKIDIKSLPKGIYVIKVDIDGNYYYNKLVIQ